MKSLLLTFATLFMGWSGSPNTLTAQVSATNPPAAITTFSNSVVFSTNVTANQKVSLLGSTTINSLLIPSRLLTSSNAYYTCNLATNHNGTFFIVLNTNIVILPPTNTYPGEHWSIQLYQGTNGNKTLTCATNAQWRPTMFGQIPLFQTNANTWCADIECITDKTGSNTVFWFTSIQ